MAMLATAGLDIKKGTAGNVVNRNIGGGFPFFLLCLRLINFSDFGRFAKQMTVFRIELLRFNRQFSSESGVSLRLLLRSFFIA